MCIENIAVIVSCSSTIEWLGVFYMLLLCCCLMPKVNSYSHDGTVS